jgi:hypothetical protein
VAAVIDATLKGASSNSYVTLAEANSYFETVPDSLSWDDKGDDQKNRALISATRFLDALNYYGKRCSETQALKWPRKDFTVDTVELVCTLIPPEVKTATYELARALANNPSAVTGSTGTTGIYDEVEIGDLKVKYNTDTQTPGLINNIFDEYPWLQGFLGAYCIGGASNYAVKVLRN